MTAFDIQYTNVILESVVIDPVDRLQSQMLHSFFIC